jgi:type II secretory ATPase GspE/PulE/Tfp pilus assembly ATPase PilB-like protein
VNIASEDILLDELANELQVELNEAADLDSLLESGELSEEHLIKIFSDVSEIEHVLEDTVNNLEKMKNVNLEYLDSSFCLPLKEDEQMIELAFCSLFGLKNKLNHWQVLYAKEIKPKLMRKSFISRKINEIYHQSDELGEFDENASQSLEDMAKEAPIVRLVNDVFSRAVELGASDIHVEPGDGQLNIRYRIDGILHTHFTPPFQQFAAISSRLKLIGGLNIAERRIPQDGRIELTISGKAIDVRMNTLPGMYGESIVMRLLQKNLQDFTLESIGMSEHIRDKFNEKIKRPYGLILVVGPTGSGKTTTLYCALNILNSGNEKIITIEDPIEYQINGITQVQVKKSIGLSFADGLRSIVRQDPDIILVGEIRDKETAEISINAALTGHLVLSTLHTNDAAGAISRLQDMGVENFLIASSLVAVLSQRLLRRICSACGGDEEKYPCRKCASTGYKGRVGVYEFLEVDQQIQNAIMEQKDSGQINQIAVAQGMQTIADNANEKVIEGVTSREEQVRVCSAN